MRISPLSRHHDRESFDCGNDELNLFFHNYASQAVRNRDCTCFVALDEENGDVIGFFTLSAAEIAFDKIKGFGVRSGYSSVPMTRLGRLAVSCSCQGRGIGRGLVAAAVEIAKTQGIGSKGLVVEAKTDDLLDFYAKLGFRQVNDPQMSRQLVFMFPKAKLA